MMRRDDMLRGLRSVPWTMWLAIVLAAVIFHSWYFSAGTLTFGDWKAILPASVSNQFPFGHLWLGNERLGFPMTNFIPFYTAFSWAFKLGLPFALVERVLFFWFFPVLTLAGTYGLARAITRDRLASGLAAIAMLLHVETLTVAIGGHTNATNATALVPWAMWATLRFVQTRRLAWLAVLVLAIAATCAFDLRWVPPTAVVCLALAAVWALYRRSWEAGVNAVIVAVGIIVAVLAENLYWLLPKLIGSSVAPAPPNGNLDVVWVLRSSVLTWFDALAGWNPYFMNTFERPPLIMAPVPIFALVLPLCAIVAGLATRRRLATFAIAGLLFSAFLGKGSQEPFGGIYLWAFSNVPAFGAYRDPSKLESYTGIFLALLLAFGVVWLRALPKRWPAHAGAIAASAILITLAFHVLDPSVGGVLKARATPAHYSAVNALLERDRNYGRILWLPEVPRWVDHTLIHPAVDAADLGRSEFWNYTRGGVGASDVLSFVQTPVFSDLLRWGGFRYVAVAQDAENDATVSGGATSIVKTLDQLRHNRALRESNVFGPVVVFTVRGATAHAWVADTATLVQGSFSGLHAAAIVPGTLGWNPLVFAQDALPNVPFARVLTLDGAGTPLAVGDGLPHGAIALAPRAADRAVLRRERIVGDDALKFGPAYGDAVIDEAGPGPGVWNARFVNLPAGTSAVPPVVDRRPPSLAPSQRAPIARGVLLQHRGSGAVRLTLLDGTPWYDRTSVPHSFTLTDRLPLIVRNDLPVAVQITLSVDVEHGALALEAGGRSVRAGAGATARLVWTAPSGASALEVRADSKATYGAPRITLESTTQGPAAAGVMMTRVPVPALPLYDHPVIHVAGSNTDVKRGRLIALYEMRDRVSGARMTLVGPTLDDERDVLAPIEIRSWMQEVNYSEAGPLQPLALDDAYDRLDLVGVDVVAASVSAEPLLAAVDRIVVLRGSEGGEPIASGEIIPAALLRSERIVSRATRPGSAMLTFDFSQRGAARTNWAGTAVILGNAAGTERAAIVSDDGRFLRGFTANGTTFVRPWGSVTAITDGPEVAVLDVPLPRALDRGVLAFDVHSDDPTMHIRLALGIDVGAERRWSVRDTTAEQVGIASRYARVRLDIATALATASPSAFARLSAIKIYFDRVGNSPSSTSIVRMSDVSLINTGGTLRPRVFLGDRDLVPGLVTAGDERVHSTPGAGLVPAAVVFSRGAPLQDRFLPLALGALNQRAVVNVPNFSRWLVFSERYDPGWQLRDANGEVVPGHMIGFGFINVWYAPAGLVADVTLEYMPDRFAPLGMFLGYGALLALLVWTALAFTLRRRSDA